jgi:hypothetical protein
MRAMPGTPFIASSIGRVPKQSLRRRRFAVIGDDHDAREISLRENGDRKLPRCIDPGRAKQRHDDENRAGLIRDDGG